MKYKYIFFLLFTFTIALWSLRIYDFFYGDATGYVGGINIAPIVKGFSIVTLILLVFYSIIEKKRFIQNVLLSAVSTIVIVVILELASFAIIKLQSSKSPKIEGPSHSMELNDVLGYVPKPNSTHRGLRTINEKIVYDISYKSDSNSLRITPVETTELKKTNFGLFFGCSMTFGEGVNSNETIPYFFGKINKNYQPYNFAYSGYGPHQMLARLQTSQVQKIVQEKEGYGFFIYINDHVNRVIGNMTNYSYNGGNAPYFYKSNNELKNGGLFKNGRRLRSLVYNELLKSNTLKLFKIGLPFKLTEEDYDLTSEIISKSKELYTEQFKNDNFYVVIYPTKINSKRITNLLEKKGVKVLDYSKLFDEMNPKYSIPFDEHPTPLANKILVDQIARDLKLTEK